MEGGGRKANVSTLKTHADQRIDSVRWNSSLAPCPFKQTITFKWFPKKPLIHFLIRSILTSLAKWINYFYESCENKIPLQILHLAGTGATCQVVTSLFYREQILKLFPSCQTFACWQKQRRAFTSCSLLFANWEVKIPFFLCVFSLISLTSVRARCQYMYN